MPAELKTNKRVSRGETYIHQCARGKTKTIAAAKYDSKTNNERSSQLSATGSQQPTANSKQPPGGADDDGGGDDGGDGYDDDDVISRVPRFQVRAPPRERYPVDYQTVSSRSTGSAQKQGFRRAETPFHPHEANKEKKTSVSGENKNDYRASTSSSKPSFI